MGVQDLTVQMVVIVVIGVFFASFMDAIAGGGGIISVPTYLLAGLPMHFALGTNKFSSSIENGSFPYMDVRDGAGSVCAGALACKASR